jgi:hypothetical protein
LRGEAVDYRMSMDIETLARIMSMMVVALGVYLF